MMPAAFVMSIALVLACGRPPRSERSPSNDTASSDTASAASNQAPAASVTPGAPTVPARPGDLDAPRSAFSRAFAAGDTMAFDSLFVEDEAVIDMAGMDPEPLQGSSGIRLFARRVASFQAAAGPRFTPDTVQFDEPTAREAGHWSWSPGAQKTKGSYSIAWRRDPEGRWRVAEYRFSLR